MNSTPRVRQPQSSAALNRTPAASKFLLPKRSTQSSQAPRFLPTPRFASSGTRATQASGSIEDVDENELGGFSGSEPTCVDDDHESLEELEVTREELPRRTRGHLSLEESIEVESVIPSDSLAHESSEDEVAQSSWRYNSIDGDLEEPMPSSPLAKRRKISISPLPTSSPQASDHLGEDLFQEKLQQVIEDNSPKSEFAGEHGSDGSPDLSDLESAMQNHGPQQPTFRAPPRFKPLEDEVSIAELPDFFSPRRRGQKYVPGGLAAGLQGWLSEVREGEGKHGTVESPFRIRVDELRPGTAMNLVRGTKLGESEERKNFILAAFALARQGAAQRRWKSHQETALYRTNSGKKSEPLRILFCGTDTVSTESLHALHEEMMFNEGLVESIECVLLPPKPSGRGRKFKIETPMMRAADALGLSTHSIHTFTDWEPPKTINLIVVVSFGLFVPKRILRSVKYGGLNVHPSFLPDLRGPAPIHHAVLRGDKFMGVSLQTLDEEQIDHGVVLSQTQRPGVRIMEHPTLSRVNRKLAMEGADLLVQGLRDGVHIPPYVDAGWKAKELEGKPLQHAPKITKADTQIDWLKWTAQDWKRRIQISQAVWTTVASSVKGQVWIRRLLFHDVMEVPREEVTGFKATMEVITQREGEEEQRFRKLIAINARRGFLYMRLDNHTWIRVRRATLEGKIERPAAAAVRDFVIPYTESQKPPTKGEINEWKGDDPFDSKFEERRD
ncbi:unnamed protein product [Clonostachys rosea]|uniref:methionyl-tRNA formyltransferase n=1 Tax=Bionectria ochroleuca TaxID=29856 RepID=A0ABY6TQD8_BIOOC|nr:unnamed protein product [Clonostachys rosea]